jgi:hypothetical protein
MARGDDTLQDGDSGSGPPRESAGPLDAQLGPPGEVQDLHRYKPDPWDGSRTLQEGSGLLTVGSRDSKAKCKENGPRAIWLNRFWCLMINTTCELMYFPSVCVL